MMAKFKYPLKAGEELETSRDKNVIIGKRISSIIENRDLGETFLIFDDGTMLELSCSIDDDLIWTYHEEKNI